MNEEVREEAVEAQEAGVLSQEQPVQEQNNKATHHLYQMRKKLEAEEDARKSAERKYAELERYVSEQQSKGSQPVTQIEEEDIHIDNEDYVQAKHVKTSNTKLKKQLAEQAKRLQDIERRYEYLEAKSDTSTLKDFEQVVNTDNMKLLATLYPDDYESVMANPNLKSRSRTAYNMLKNYNLLDKDNNNSSNSNAFAEAKINSNKFRPQTAALANAKPAQSPLTEYSDARRIHTEADIERINRETQRKKESWGLI